MNGHSADEHFAWCSTMHAFAQVYADSGFAVLPLMRGGKRPSPVAGNFGGVHNASRERNRVSAWWGASPHANVGVACGYASGGLIVIDIDVKHVNGYRSLHEECLRLGLAWPVRLPPTAETPSGGMHIWMRWPWVGGVPGRTGLLPGVDVKGDGGYVAAPPSGLVMPRLEGGQPGTERIVPYSWSNGCPCELPAITPSMGEWIATSPASGAAGGVASGASSNDALVAGNRNNALSAKAASLYRRHGTDDRGAALVQEEVRSTWERMDNSGFPWSEVVTILTHARAFVKRKEEEERRWAESTNPGWLRKMGG